MKMLRKLAMRILALGMILLATLGFRLFPGIGRWPTNVDDSTVWVTFCQRPADFSTNDLPASDAFAGQTPTFTGVTQSVFDDYATVGTSYYRLADSSTDPNYSAASAVNRNINVCFNSLSISTSGHAIPTMTNGKISGCTVSISEKLVGANGSVKGFVQAFTHELGHCAGLAHPMETVNAIMSYFSTGVRLQEDDRMGLTYLYPTDPSYAHEVPTLGLSCAPN